MKVKKNTYTVRDRGNRRDNRDQRTDLYIDKIERINSRGTRMATLNEVRKSVDGKWLTFKVYMKNKGLGCARRVTVSAIHTTGMEWPSMDDYISVFEAGQSATFTVRILIPQTAVVMAGHKIRFMVDSNRVNQDRDWSNNIIFRTFSVLAPGNSDLTITQFRRNRISSGDDWGGFQRGWVKFTHTIKVANRGNGTSPETKLNFVIQKVDHRNRRPSPQVHKDWSYTIPSLRKGASHTFDTRRWNAYTDQTCRIDAHVDPDNRIQELDENNNHRSDQFGLSVNNPFAGTFLGGFYEDAYDASVVVGGAIYDGGNWVYKKLKAGSQAALATLMVPEMEAWVQLGYLNHVRYARDLNAREKELLAPYFPSRYIDGVKIRFVPQIIQPELWGDGRGVTYNNAISGHCVFVLEEGTYDDNLLIHEMVHAYQYRKLGLTAFCWEYVYTWVKSGFVYRDISLEDQAYSFVSGIDEGSTQRIGEYLGY